MRSALHEFWFTTLPKIALSAHLAERGCAGIAGFADSIAEVLRQYPDELEGL